MYSIFVRDSKRAVLARGIRRVSLELVFVSPTGGPHPFTSWQPRRSHSSSSFASRRFASRAVGIGGGGGGGGGGSDRLTETVHAAARSSGKVASSADDPNLAFCGHLSPVRSLCFSPSGSELYSGE